jgi:hypothetical protein
VNLSDTTFLTKCFEYSKSVLVTLNTCIEYALFTLLGEPIIWVRINGGVVKGVGKVILSVCVVGPYPFWIFNDIFGGLTKFSL